MEAFNKELKRQLFKSMALKSLKTLKIGNIKSLMTGIKPKYAIKTDIAKLDKSEAYPEEDVLPEDGLNRYLYQPGEQQR